MRFKTALLLMTIAGGIGLSAAPSLAQDAAKKPHKPLEKTIGQVTPTAPIPSLAVINSAGATLDGTKLVLTGVSKNSIVFADRPIRAAGHVTTEQFIMQWDEGKDNFAIDPPNATISILGGDGSDVNDAVVTLKTPKLEGDTLTFDVAVLEGNLNNASGPAALFIDAFAVSGPYGGGFAHVGGYGGYGTTVAAHTGTPQSITAHGTAPALSPEPRLPEPPSERPWAPQRLRLTIRRRPAATILIRRATEQRRLN